MTRLIIKASHKRALHGGVQSTLGVIRQRFWIPRGRALVKQLLRRCVICVRWRAAIPQQIMGNLPPDRVTLARPFLHTGVDYAGPILLRTAKAQGHRAHKAFLAVFVCLSTRAVHLEVVSDYTSEVFLAALRRFFSRRGICSTLQSDCGTNFVGADTQLRAPFAASSPELRKIVGGVAGDGIQWRFNPPAAPHFGGIWEAAVKSLKHHLRRVLGDATLTFEEMSTLLAQIEACLNSRPLQALSDDPEDLAALTQLSGGISPDRNSRTIPGGATYKSHDSLAAAAEDATSFLGAMVARVLTLPSPSSQMVALRFQFSGRATVSCTP